VAWLGAHGQQRWSAKTLSLPTTDLC